jgi:hypothetical protein
MRVLLWHVHGSWTTAFVQGRHDYLLPVTPDRGPDGRGRAQTWTWPSSAREVPVDRLRAEEVDVVVLQRPEDEHLAASWLGRTPGRDLPAIYVEHNAPQGRVNDLRHPVADRPDLHLVHVTHANALFWDAGATPTSVIEHGVPDPGYRYTGELARLGVVVNEPGRRGRVVGADLYPWLAGIAPVDLFGMGCAGHAAALSGRGLPVVGHEDPPQARLHAALPERRVYVHPYRWTSLGLALLEAMHLGMPVVALATTEVPVAVPPEAGVVGTRLADLERGIRLLLHDRDAAIAMGRRAREAALARYGLQRFLDEWDDLMVDVFDRRPVGRSAR